MPERWAALRVAGARQDEHYAAEVERRIASSGLGDRVELLGHRDDVVAFLAEIDALVVPSVGNEGQPTVILEALATGVPVIGARAGGLPEVVRDGETGALLPVGDVEGMADAAIRYLTDPALWLAASALAQSDARARFGMDAVVEQYEALYGRMTG
jgi:glycosyltransferase involved in cell wall biosynthesis